MKFYGREIEMEILQETREMSKKAGTFTVMTGCKHIGKTSLILESERGNKFLYFPVPRSTISVICKQLTEAACVYLGLELINTGRFDDLFEQIMQHGRKNNFTFVLDEFQELERADPSITSSMQNIWDEHKGSSMVDLICCGSDRPAMTRIFWNYREPLYGRAISNFNLRPFKPSVIKTILKDHNPSHSPDDLLLLHMVAGG
ncbi:MAG: hypothetical protein LBH88_04040, partial [Candidatus Methanoplasma sp.]|nr:hypothetical protein [Candidatus Methanoplasma sp.]